jgi:hypothetical protein
MKGLVNLAGALDGRERRNRSGRRMVAMVERRCLKGLIFADESAEHSMPGE